MIPILLLLIRVVRPKNVPIFDIFSRGITVIIWREFSQIYFNLHPLSLLMFVLWPKNVPLLATYSKGFTVVIRELSYLLQLASNIIAEVMAKWVQFLVRRLTSPKKNRSNWLNYLPFNDCNSLWKYDQNQYIFWSERLTSAIILGASWSKYDWTFFHLMTLIPSENMSKIWPNRVQFLGGRRSHSDSTVN